jgi:hypothetical protein
MAFVTAAWATLALSAAVLVLGIYYRGGAPALRENAKLIWALFVGVVILVVLLTIANLVAGT